MASLNSCLLLITGEFCMMKESLISKEIVQDE